MTTNTQTKMSPCCEAGGKLKDQVAVITGSARGIGRAIAEAMLREGARVVISDINAEATQQTTNELKQAGGQVLGVACNVTDNASIEKMVDEVVNHWGRIDILVNNAGITRDNLMMRMSEEEWQAVIDTNLTSAFKVTKPVLKVMSKQRSGRIVNIASTTGVHGNRGQVNYAAAKAGLIGFTKTIALEYASRNITSNAVAPGFIDTAMTQKLGEEIINNILKNIPLGRMGTPEDIAQTVVFLAGAGSYITGQVIEVNGGLYT
jgi:3-oxoacyl-[acyl-carrier protein] reductase